MLAICFGLLVTDGFDAQSIAFVAPVLIMHWGVTRIAFGTVFSAGLFGLMLGAVFFSVAADHYGHRRILLCCAAWYGIFTLLTTLSNTLPMLWILRFVTGFGLGGAMPIITGIVSESSPGRLRIRFITLSLCGFSLGGVIGGFVSSPLINAYGWTSVFIAGGLLPLLLAPFAARLLPESLPYQIRVGYPRAAVENELNRVIPGFRLVGESSDEKASRDSQISKRNLVLQMFAPGFTIATLMIWCACFMNLIALYFLLNWLPTVIHESGLSLRAASITTGLFSVGGMIGALTLSWCVDRLIPQRMLAFSFIGAMCCITAEGQVHGMVAIMLATSCAGFFVIGSQIAFNSFVGRFYPVEIRATGVGWMLGIGRLGAVVGPLIGGLLLSLKLPVSDLFMCAAVPLAIAALSILFVRTRGVATQGHAAKITKADAASTLQ